MVKLFRFKRNLYEDIKQLEQERRFAIEELKENFEKVQEKSEENEDEEPFDNFFISTQHNDKLFVRPKNKEKSEPDTPGAFVYDNPALLDLADIDE